MAVISVILFHAGFNTFSGGFVGVDVFFVISGYLITKIIFTEISQNCFSLTHFYEKRARRILPVLLFILLIITPFSWYFLLPSDLKDYSESVLAVLSFTSNILFWRESGYFEADAELKPLLHTWSLAVEEQYYIIFPLFLIVIYRLMRDKSLWAIITVAVASLFICEYGWRYSPNANFYLTPTRIWEILIGAICAIIQKKYSIKQNRFLCNVGILMIIGAIFIYDELTPFPSFYTLLPVIGAASFILFVSKDTLSYRILSNSNMVMIGLLSYSAYLWHQPIFALYRYKFNEQHNAITSLLLILIIIILSWFTWKFIEIPFRETGRVSKKKLLFVLSACYLILVNISVIGSLNIGQSLTVFREDPYQPMKQAKSEAFKTTRADTSWPTVMLWGDSFADVLVEPLNNHASMYNSSVISYIKHSCPSLVDTYRNEPYRLAKNFAETCKDFGDKVKANITRAYEKSDYLVLTSAYFWYATALNHFDEPILTVQGGKKISPNETIRQSLVKTVKWAETLGLRPIVLLAPPAFGEFKNTLRSDINLARSYSLSQKEIVEFNNFLADALRTTTAMVINPIDLLCEGHSQNCSAYDQEANQFIISYDGSHLSNFGAKLVASRVAELINFDFK